MKIKYFCNFCNASFDNQLDCENHEKSHDLENKDYDMETEISLKDAIETMENAIKRTDHSDELLESENCETRHEMFCGEYLYGISVVPASFACNLAKELLKITNNPNMIIKYEYDDK